MHEAAIVAVGSEMLGPTRLDTNSLKITANLERYAIPVVRKSVVGDRLEALISEIRYALARCGLLVLTGGLGPTEDDLTREALSEAVGVPLDFDSGVLAQIETRFAARGWKMPEVNRKQAMVFRGQTTLNNERGSAPGAHLRLGEKDVWVFPGVPHELEWMIATYFAPWLTRQAGGRSSYRRVVKIAGMGESAVEEALGPYYRAHPGEVPTILATGGQVEIHLAATGTEEEARAAIVSRERDLLEIFGTRVFGFDDDTMESAVGALLKSRGETLAAAESCTGGLFGSRITDVPGSSAYFLGGAVCYTAEAKTALAGVDPELLRAHGEVSEEVARALAEGIRARFGATWGVGITGIAGPTGGTPGKPVGTVHLAVSSAAGMKHRKLLWQGPRATVKWYSTQQAMDLLRRMMMG